MFEELRMDGGAAQRCGDVLAQHALAFPGREPQPRADAQSRARGSAASESRAQHYAGAREVTALAFDRRELRFDDRARIRTATGVFAAADHPGDRVEPEAELTRDADLFEPKAIVESIETVARGCGRRARASRDPNSSEWS